MSDSEILSILFQNLLKIWIPSLHQPMYIFQNSKSNSQYLGYEALEKGLEMASGMMV